MTSPPVPVPAPRWMLVLLLMASIVLPASAAQYAGSAACRACHEVQFEAWRGSHHGMAMQPVGADAVRGDFDDASLAARGGTVRFFRRDGGYWLNTSGPDGIWRDYRIAWTFGVEPLQQYLVEFPDGRLQAIPFAWDSRPRAAGGQRWFDLYPQFTRPTDEFYWTGPGQNWNYMCSDCHSTDVRKRYDEATNRYASTWGEVSVGCEACHGPGSAHLDWAAAGAAGSDRGFDRQIGRPASAWSAVEGKHTLQPSTLRESMQEEVCWQCHSRRQQLHDGPATPGAGFLDRHLPSLLGGGLYHADGQIDEEVFEYGSFLQAKMHARGVVCSDCHDPHSAGLRRPLESLCTQCHEQQTYASGRHHFHPEGSAGAACVGCHMPATTYMQVDARHDHAFSIPDPALSAEIGAPDACTRCHADRKADWAAGVLREHGVVSGKRPASLAARAFHAADRREPAAENQLAWIAADPAQAPIVRASALQRLQNGAGPNARVSLRRGALDPQALLRLGAIDGSAGLPPADRWELLAPLLADRERAVRTEAAATLAPLWPQLDEARRALLRAPLDDYVAIQAFNADRGFARTNLGNLRRNLGEVARAEADYRGAIAIEPGFAPAWVNLADLLRTSGRDADGRALLEQGAHTLPASGEIQHALGLARVRGGDRAGGETALARAVEMAPGVARFRYVLGIALSDHDAAGALLQLRRAWELERDPQYLYAACEQALRSGDGWAGACLGELRPILPPEAMRALESQRR